MALHKAAAVVSSKKAVEEILKYGILDTKAAVSSLVDKLSGLPSTPPSLYVDIEGVNLSRYGPISILQIHSRTTKKKLPRRHKDTRTGRILYTRNRTPNTLKVILESPSTPKVFFDVRNDSIALYAQYGVKLQGIHDIQLMEFAARTRGETSQIVGFGFGGLTTCVSRDILMTDLERHKWSLVKKKGQKHFCSRQRGDTHIFDQRPLPRTTAIYCVQDVHYLPRLWDLYDRKLTAEWKTKVQDATEARVLRTQTLSPD